MSIVNRFFELSEGLITNLCERASENLPEYLIHIDQNPYLRRFYLFRRSMLDSPIAKYLPSVYLHYFYRGDQDRALHNHPWGFSVSLILTNGYSEERLTPKGVVKRKIRPGSLNVIRANDFHRVDLVDDSKGAWTLFVSGPRVQEWGFFDPHKPQEGVIPWRDFIENRELNGSAGKS